MKIENKLAKYKKYYKNVCISIAAICKQIPDENIQAIDKIVLLDSHENVNYKHVGGMYFLKRDSNPAYIEVYVKELIYGMPKGIPKAWIFLNYSFARLILHEIGHHVNQNYAYERNSDEWELTANKYGFKQLWKIYGLWMYIFLTISSIDNRLHKRDYGIIVDKTGILSKYTPSE